MENQFEKTRNSENEGRESKLARLQSPECVKAQEALRVELLRNEKALKKSSEIMAHREKLAERLMFFVGQLMDQNTDTLPAQSNISPDDPRSDPKSIVSTARTEWAEYDERYREDVAAVYDHIATFCKEYDIDFNPYFRASRMIADTLWTELQKAYLARMSELEHGDTRKIRNLYE